MILNPDTPHDSRAETLKTHRSEEAMQSMADIIAEPFRPTAPEVIRSRLWPDLPPVTLREEIGLWEN